MTTKNDFAVTLDADGYYSLASVLKRAFDQASQGKGKERHANALPFDQQPMQTIAAQVGVGFLTGQAIKKTQEAGGLQHDAKIAELLGAINYLAGAVIFLEAQGKAANVMSNAGMIHNIDADDWIEWTDIALHAPTGRVAVQYRDGNSNVMDAGMLNWNHICSPRDIIKWRKAYG